METAPQVLGLGLMVLGMLLLIVCVFRALGHLWVHGAYEIWLLPLVAGVLILTGRWLIR